MTPMPLPRRPDHYGWLIVAALLFLFAICISKCSAEEFPDFTKLDVAYAKVRGLPDELSVNVTIVRVNATGREESRAQATSRIMLPDWVLLHAQTIDKDAQCYLEHGFVRLTIVYCGDLL